MRLTHLTKAELIRYHRLSYTLLLRYQTRRAWKRLAMVVIELDARDKAEAFNE